MVARDYELTYETVLNFASGARLPIKAKLVGELNQRVIIRDAQGRPVRYSGYTQGLAEISDTDGHVIFRGATMIQEPCSLWWAMMLLHPSARESSIIGRMGLAKARTPGALTKTD